MKLALRSLSSSFRAAHRACMAALLLAVLPAQASFHRGECVELVVPGQSTPQACSGEFGLSNVPGGPAGNATSVRLNYGGRDGKGGRLHLRFDAVEGAEGGDLVMPIVAVYHARFVMNAAQSAVEQSGSSVGPARGQCRVTGVEAPPTVLRCEVQAAQGPLRVTIRVPDAGISRLVVRDLRETRFALAQAAQSGRLPAPWPTEDQPMRAVQAPELDERTCAGEEQALRAEEMAKGGKAGADRLAAVCYGRAAKYGPDRARLWAKAREWFERAIARDDAEAMFQYGLIGQEVRALGLTGAAGSNLRPSPAELEQIVADSMALYNRAAERGLPAAQTMLCSTHAFGGPRVEDPVRALSWCQKILDAGIGKGATVLAAMYAQGRGVPRDLPTSYQLAMKGAELGDVGALMDLGRAYERGAQDSPFGPLPRDVRKAADAYRRAGNAEKAAQLDAASAQVGGGVDTSVFGLSVGFTLPGNIGQCGMRGNDPGATMCFDREAGEITRLFDRLGLGTVNATQLGLRLRVLELDGTKLETAFLVHVLGAPANVEVLTDTQGTLQYLTMMTQITQGDAVLRMLTQKYGRPTRTEFTEWRDPRNGQLLRKTPVTFWELKGVTTEFHAQAAYTLTNTEAPHGRINVYSTLFASTLQRLRSQQAEAAPAKKGF